MTNDNEQTVPRSLITADAKPKTKSKLKSCFNIIYFIGIFMIVRFILKLYRDHKSNKPNQHTPNDHGLQLQRMLDYHLSLTESRFKWKQHANTILGGSELNQLDHPQGTHIDIRGQSIYIADYSNHRIVQWYLGGNSGQIIAGGNGEGNRIDQLSFPANVIIDQNNNSLIICDQGNRRVVRWSLASQQIIQIIIENIICGGLQMSENGDLFIADTERHVVKKWKKDDNKGIIVAGGKGKGHQFDQLNSPTFIFVDQEDTVYVSDRNNHRVMKWLKNAKNGAVVAGGHGNGNNSNQLSYPQGLFVSKIGNVYVADQGNHRIMRWPSDSQNGHVIAGGNLRGKESHQLNGPIGLSFDAHKNLYIADSENNRIQRFELDRK